jgi:hypothetical protein
MSTLARKRVVVLFAAVLFVSATEMAGASRSQSEMMVDESLFFGLCAAAGGHAETTYYTVPATGEIGYIVVCRGGLLDGESCVIDPDLTFCSWGRVVEVDSDTTISGLTPDIKPLDEPVRTPPGGVVEAPETIAPPVEADPNEGGENSEPTPEPDVDTGVHPVIDDQAISDGDGASAEPTEDAGGDEGPIVDGTLDVAPDVDGSMSSGDETSQPIEVFQPIIIEGLPAK